MSHDQQRMERLARIVLSTSDYLGSIFHSLSWSDLDGPSVIPLRRAMEAAWADLSDDDRAYLTIVRLEGERDQRDAMAKAAYEVEAAQYDIDMRWDDLSERERAARQEERAATAMAAESDDPPVAIVARAIRSAFTRIGGHQPGETFDEWAARTDRALALAAMAACRAISWPGPPLSNGMPDGDIEDLLTQYGELMRRLGRTTTADDALRVGRDAEWKRRAVLDLIAVRMVGNPPHSEAGAVMGRELTDTECRAIANAVMVYWYDQTPERWMDVVRAVPPATQGGVSVSAFLGDAPGSGQEPA